METSQLDPNIKNVLSQYVENQFRFKNQVKICFGGNLNKIGYHVEDVKDDPIANSIVNLALREFMNHGLYVIKDEGYIIYEKYDQDEKNIQKAQCDNDQYMFDKCHTCMFLLRLNESENNGFNIYPNYEEEHVHFPILPLFCGVEAHETVKRIAAHENTILTFKGDLYYQDLPIKEGLIRVTIQMMVE